MTTTGRERRARWWHSLYWRVGLGFVACVIALLLAQSAIFIYWVERPGQSGPRQSQMRRLLAAAELGRAFEQAAPFDVEAILRRHADPGGPLYVVLTDGTAIAPGRGTIPDGARQTALLMLRGEAPRADQPVTIGGPATFAPIEAGGMLKGVVVAAPPPARGVLHEFTRVLSPQNVLVLLGLTAVAALTLVGPARRRLAGLELATVTGSVAGGYTAALTVAI